MKPAVQAGRWGASFLVALGLHAAPIAVTLWWLAHSGAATPPPAAPIVIELAPLAVSPQIPPRETPPGPEQIKADAPSPPAEKPRPVVEEAEIPQPVPAPPSPPEEQEPAPDTTAPPVAPAPPGDDPAAPTEGVPAASSDDVLDWQSQILGHLDRHKRYPSDAARRGLEGVPYVRFALDREGRVVFVRLERSCGVAALDEEAVALVHRAQPFPAPPADVPGDAIELVAPVEFYKIR